MNLKNEPIIKEYINNLSNITYDKKCFKHNNFYLKTLYKQNLFEIKAILFPQKSSKLDIWNKIGIIQLYFNHSLVDEFHISHSSKENVLLEGFSFFSLENIMSGKEKIDENTHIFKPFLVDVFTLAYCRFVEYTFSPELLNAMACLDKKSQLKIQQFLFYNQTFTFSDYKNLCEFFILSHDYDITDLLNDPYSIERVEKKLTNKKISFS